MVANLNKCDYDYTSCPIKLEFKLWQSKQFVTADKKIRLSNLTALGKMRIVNEAKRFGPIPQKYIVFAEKITILKF